MSAKIVKSIVVGCVAAVASGAWGAEWLGASDDSRWGTAANWEGEAVPEGAISFSSQAGENKTVTLDGDYSFGGAAVIDAGTPEAPFVFTATDEAVAAANSLNQTTAGNLSLKGALKVEKGVWNFANDILPQGGYLHLTGGRMTTKYWMPVSGNSTIIVDDGELVMGYRDNGERDNGRINLANSADAVVTLTQNGGRIRCSNNVNKPNDAEALTIGEQARTTTTVNLNGGELIANGKVHIGYGAVTSAALNINGGTLTTTHDILIGRNGNGEMTISSGIVNCGSPATKRYVFIGNNNSSTAGGTLNLNGGVLTAGSVRNGSATATSVLNLNGGTLKAEANQTGETEGLIPVNEHLTVTVGAGGAIIDTDIYSVEISHPLVSGVEDGIDGGLVKCGPGRLVLTGAADYTGDTTVEEGALVVTAGCAFNGALTIGSHGAMEVQIPEATAEALTVGSQIQLFKASSVNLEYEDDTLAEAVFLTGKVFDYTLAIDDDGWVVATVTDVANLALTRKLTTFVATENYIDQNASWSNGQPNHDSYDIIVFTRDASMIVYAAGWGAGNNRACDKMVLRGATVLAQSLNDWNPSLDKRNIIGHGTLQLRRLGLQCRNALGSGGPIVGKNITIEIVKTASDHDTWSEEPVIYGTLKVTTGYTLFNNNSKVYGDAYYLNPNKESAITADRTGNYIGGTWTVADGCTFNFNGNSVEFGENAKLVLEGTGKITGAENIAFPTVVMGSAFAGRFSSLPACGAGGYVLDGGALTMSTTALEEAETSLLVKAGSTLMLYVADIADIAEGTVVSVHGVSLADEVTMDDVAFKTCGAPFDWAVALTEEGTLQLTAQAPNGPNRWVGSSTGNWGDGANWKYGVPLAEQSLAFDSTCRITSVQNTINLNEIIVKAGVDVEFVTQDAGRIHPSLNVNAVVVDGEDEATIALYHVGVQSRGDNIRADMPANLNFRMTCLSTDSWLKNLNLNGKLLGEGIFRSYACHLGGDNSGFNGTVYVANKDRGTEIVEASAGASNAVWQLEEDVNFRVKDGVFKMGELRMANEKLWYTDDDSVATIEVGHKNTDFGSADCTYFFGSSTYDPARNVPNISFRKVGTGTWTYAHKGVCHIEVAEGTLNLVENKSSNTHFDGFNGKQIDTLVVRSGAALTGSSGAQPIYSLTMEPGSIIKTKFSEMTTTTTNDEGEEVVTTTVVQSAYPTVTGPVSVNGVIVDVEGADLVKADERYPLLTVTGEGNAMTGKAMLKDGLAFPAEGRPWCVKTKPQTLQLAEFYNFVITIR